MLIVEPVVTVPFRIDDFLTAPVRLTDETDFCASTLLLSGAATVWTDHEVTLATVVVDVLAVAVAEALHSDPSISSMILRQSGEISSRV